ncbi:hypothetical protein [Denitratisoma oestradiolicum]|uniref:Uncharacterized protein n=1 Tax=Denitratisoma oestradiolicum TaxID=311182 RepID=A0A6S6Y465_9PROT|nr:hypothetical protein [Denitratisoma oestradiolicum]TWO80406.1 hypothetical protein CBW56_09895 [Denitratisoma oestradiolicum]CAB1370217.1 conserved protein of unknown function [Denitratisoma oestradiolicum]
MKRTDLAKSLGLKIMGQMSKSGTPQRFGQAAASLPDKKEQRRRDQALGLVPFAVKIDKELVQSLQQRAADRQVPLNTMVEELLRAGLAAEK